MIEISLPIILYLHFTRDPNSSILWEKSFAHLLRNLHFCPRDLWAELHPFTTSIPKVACDQVWYERPLFYNSNFSIPNGLASPFGKAQLDDTKLRSFRQVQRGRPLDDDKFCMDSFLQTQASRSKPAGQQEVQRLLWYIRPVLPAPTIPRLQLCFFLVGYQFKRRKNQTVKAPLSWVAFKAFFWKSLEDSRASVYITWSCIRQD